MLRPAPMDAAMRRLTFVVGAALALGVSPAVAQPAAPQQQSEAATPNDKPALKQEELDALLAPVALYPDPVLTQLLMASTYPIEVVEADRWVKDPKNKNLKGDALTKALEAKSWDPSVKSLVSFPDVLAMMSRELEWTSKLGDAVLDQQQQVMSTVQSLRAKAKTEGNLKTTEQQTVKTQTEGSKEVIVIEPASPQTIYVPQYNPAVVYGAWPAPSYPPYAPAGGYVATAAISFGLGVAASAAWGYAWGHASWGHGNIDVDVNRNTNINRNIDRSKYSSRTGSGRSNWQHDPSHRRGAAYRSQSTAQRFGGTRSASAVQARESFRGRAAQGRSDIAAGRVDRSSMRQAGAGQRSRPVSTSAGARRQGTAAASRSTSSRGSGLSGVNRGGSSARASSSRGHSSRSYSGGGRSRGGGGGRRR